MKENDKPIVMIASIIFLVFLGIILTNLGLPEIPIILFLATIDGVILVKLFG